MIEQAQIQGGIEVDATEELEAGVDAALEDDADDAWTKKLMGLKKSFSNKVKILLAFMQIVTTMGFNLSGIRFPKIYESFTDALKFVSFNIFLFIPLGCMSDHPTNHYTQLVMTTVTPIVFVGRLIIAYQTTNTTSFFTVRSMPMPLPKMIFAPAL